jgi:hypothetical protein
MIEAMKIVRPMINHANSEESKFPGGGLSGLGWLSNDQQP